MSSPNNRLNGGKKRSRLADEKLAVLAKLFRQAGITDENGRLKDEYYRTGGGTPDEQLQQPPERPPEEA